MKNLTKSESKNITTGELERVNAVLAGTTVVANMRKGADTVLIKWAKRNNLFVIVDRTTPFGNQFTEAAYGRSGCIEKYRQNLMDTEFEIIGGICGGSPPKVWGAICDGSFTNKVLGCWCYPLPCHGDVIAEIVNGRDRSAKPMVNSMTIRNPVQLSLF